MLFDFLKDLFVWTEGWEVNSWRRFYFRSLGRLEFGLAKYKKVMTPGDGRNSPEDAWEEAFDLCQYLLKCVKEDRGEYYVYHILYRKALSILLELEKEIGGEVDNQPKD